MAKHNDLGKEGEDKAVEFLAANGHTILHRNYRHLKAEVDIITKEGNTLVFVEVKTRSTNSFGYPEESIDKKKRKLLKQAAEEYIYQNKIDADIRFDVISFTKQNKELKIFHIKDAFFYEEDNLMQ